MNELKEEPQLITKKSSYAFFLELFVPGLGFIYARETKKAILVFVLFIIWFLLSTAIVLNFTLFIFMLTIFGVLKIGFLYNVVRTVNRMPQLIKQQYESPVFYFLVMIAVLTGMSFLPDALKNGTGIVQAAMIPTPSMSPALKIGDFFMYQTIGDVKRYDIIVYKNNGYINFLPMNDRIICRIVGMPGDQIQIKKGDLYVNHQKADTMMTCKHTYEIAGNPAENKLILEELGIMNNQRFQEKCIVALTNLEKQQVEKSIGKGKVNKFITFPTVDYGFAQNTHWTPLDYGPVKVPEKGQKVNITSENYLRYSRLILIESDGEKDAKSLIGQTYVFADNYYFLMGDNRENALDSRYIGFISEKEIVGKALYIFWSEDKSRIGTSF